jgi:protein-tyrosine phosphatase
MPEPPPPGPNDRVEVWPHLFVGGARAAEGFDGFRICVLEEPCPEGCMHLPVFREDLEGRWRTNPLLASEAVARLRHAISHGRDALVHCRSGVERSPAVAAMYLNRVHGFDLERSYAILRRTRPEIVPLDGLPTV